jgi:hypothetical protein
MTDHYEPTVSLLPKLTMPCPLLMDRMIEGTSLTHLLFARKKQVVKKGGLSCFRAVSKPYQKPI